MKKHFISMAVTATILASCGGAKTTTAEADKFDYTCLLYTSDAADE